MGKWERKRMSETQGRAPAKTKRILFVSANLRPTGGAESVAAWMLHGLARRYDVTIATWHEPDFAALDKKFGTSLAGLRFDVRTPGTWEKKLIQAIPDASNHQCANYILRMAKNLREEFDLRISCSGMEGDLGERGIQYIHYPYLANRVPSYEIPGDGPLLDVVRGICSRSIRPWMIISGYSFARMQSNLTLTNSHWTKQEIERHYRTETRVLYPPAAGEFTPVPWEEREDGFVSIGRLATAKRHADQIAILKNVHNQWPSLRFHLCGSAQDPEYFRQLKEQVGKAGDWVTLHENLSRKDLVELISRQRYGIHTQFREDFGMAPAELARAGCIPFVHNSGGQVEIVDSDARLCFDGQEDAAAKILALLKDRAAQDELRHRVQARTQRFTPEAFLEGFLEHVEKELEKRALRPV